MGTSTPPPRPILRPIKGWLWAWVWLAPNSETPSTMKRSTPAIRLSVGVRFGGS